MILLVSCRTDDYNIEKKRILEIKLPKNLVAFDADSSLKFIQKQVDFGSRVPNTKAHLDTKGYLVNTLRKYKLNVAEQNFKTTNYKNDTLNLFNILAQFKPDLKQRILLMTHWDTRPFADNDIETNWSILPDGANDGGSGTAVMLEIARNLAKNNDIELGIDFIFFDGEEAGPPMFDTTFAQKFDYYCLGSQYFVKNSLLKIKPERAILLDIVGGNNAIFNFENISYDYARPEMNTFWALAENLGYQNTFVPEYKYFVGVDDHFHINKELNIPSFAIIEYDEERNTFNKHQHKISDNVDNIDKTTLKIVGDVIWNYIINYKSLK